MKNITNIAVVVVAFVSNLFLLRNDFSADWLAIANFVDIDRLLEADSDRGDGVKFTEALGILSSFSAAPTRSAGGTYS